MGFMNLAQSSVLIVIILIFVGIVGFEMYNRFIQYREIQKAKHRKLIKKLEEEE